MRLLFIILVTGVLTIKANANAEIKYLNLKEGSCNILTPTFNCNEIEDEDIIKFFDMKAEELRGNNPKISNLIPLRKIDISRNIEYCKPWVEWQIQILDVAIKENKQNQNNSDYIPYDIGKFIQDVHDALIQKIR